MWHFGVLYIFFKFYRQHGHLKRRGARGNLSSLPSREPDI